MGEHLSLLGTLLLCSVLTVMTMKPTWFVKSFNDIETMGNEVVASVFVGTALLCELYLTANNYDTMQSLILTHHVLTIVVLGIEAAILINGLRTKKL